MDIFKFIAYGIFLWIIMFAVVSAFIAFGWYDFMLVKILTALISGGLSFYLAGKVTPENVASALKLGLIFVITGVILDAFITLRFEPAIFMAWSLWLGYVLVLLAPLARVKKKQ